ncbi:MAG: lipopolysaccharide transport system ATP-binding protein [Candidatus Magnetoglobus multicellularis str. Araruama]|uniref:Lipopolysaccharide transport system ATP-binding protein n=1 Tax=Candidatus Magnetoglobus multicellularis str. Araruama TaxID=890399 RepID=A0A1V1P1B0_9BACT|nr:MAG: lipopolysaccharide transport system ATP-binding protein [Candidatus Magnetoglobus multicellularis str. Araruama]
MDDAIRNPGQGLSKQYRIGGLKELNVLLRKNHSCHILSLFRKTIPTQSKNLFWALNNVSFDIHSGEIVGIVGRNGSGKTTLLKILARITHPTSGYADIQGRVGCLLAAGIGFHAELSGRENIFLSGTTLGLKRKEVQQKFDEIVAFSEIEKYLDTPVKRYSSGMYLRLAFAVAAHLETEILLVDEVLAVGDVGFQKKCLGKINDVAGEGRTVLFVTHDLQAIRRLCNRGLLLDQGQLVHDGNMADVLKSYAQTWIDLPPERHWLSQMPGDKYIKIESIRVCNADGKTTASINRYQNFCIEVVYHIQKANFWPALCVQFHSSEGVHLFSAHDLDARNDYHLQQPTKIKETCMIPEHLLSPGRIIVHVGLCRFSPVYTEDFMLKEIVGFDIIDNTPIEQIKGPSEKNWYGAMQPNLQWQIVLDDKTCL